MKSKLDDGSNRRRPFIMIKFFGKNIISLRQQTRTVITKEIHNAPSAYVPYIENIVSDDSRPSQQIQ